MENNFSISHDDVDIFDFIKDNEQEIDRLIGTSLLTQMKDPKGFIITSFIIQSDLHLLCIGKNQPIKENNGLTMMSIKNIDEKLLMIFFIGLMQMKVPENIKDSMVETCVASYNKKFNTLPQFVKEFKFN